MAQPLKFAIASPCSESWEGMSGDERTRFCAKCRLNVYNLSAMTRAEVDALLLAKEGGRVCGRLYQRRDGTVLTKDCPVGLARVRRRILASVTAAASLLLLIPWDRVIPGVAAVEGEASLNARARIAQVEGRLRGTRLLGPLIEWLDPAPPPMKMMMGKLVAPRPHTAPPAAPAVELED